MYYTNSPEKRASDADYYRRNAPRIRSRTADYYRDNRMQCLAKQAAYRVANHQGILRKQRSASVGRMLYDAKRRAKRYGYAFTLTRAWLEEKLAPMRCSVTGAALSVKSDDCATRYHPWSPSLDRVDSTKGYTPDNTRVVCTAYNVAKNEWSDADVLHMARSLVTKMENEHAH